MSVDRIEIRGLRVHGHHGVLPAERRDGQTFVVDALLETDLAPAGASDALMDAVDYASVVESLSSIIAGEPVDLIETLAERLAAACLADPRVVAVEIAVHKPDAPVLAAVDDIVVRISRNRGGSDT